MSEFESICIRSSGAQKGRRTAMRTLPIIRFYVWASGPEPVPLRFPSSQPIPDRATADEETRDESTNRRPRLAGHTRAVRAYGAVFKELIPKIFPRVCSPVSKLCIKALKDRPNLWRQYLKANFNHARQGRLVRKHWHPQNYNDPSLVFCRE
jgi:hypothetical protein